MSGGTKGLITPLRREVFRRFLSLVDRFNSGHSLRPAPLTIKRGSEMDIKLDIDPEDINKHVVQAIVDSSIGVQIKRVIEDKIKELDSSWNNPIKLVVEQQIREIAYDVLIKDYREVMEDMIRKQITDEVVSNLMTKAWESLKSNY